MKLIFTIFILAGLARVSAADEKQSIPVPKPFMVCKADADCQMTKSLCGCCAFTAMHKRHVKKYDALVRYCKEPQPMCKCAAPAMVPKCIKKLCQLTAVK